MHRHRLDAARAESLDQPVGAVLGPDEHEREVTFVFELANQRFDAVLVRDLDELVLDLPVGAPCRRTVLMGGGIARIALGDPSGFAVERGREEQRLARTRTRCDDPVDRGPKAHVEHPVGLVEDQHPDVLERERAPREQVLEAPGGRDQHVRRGGVLGLLDQPDATVDRRDAQRAGVCDLAEVVDDLRRELAGRREDECRGTRVLGADPLDQRDPERERLARARGRLRDHVAPGDRVADHGALNRERRGDAGSGKGADHGARHAEFSERFC